MFAKSLIAAAALATLAAGTASTAQAKIKVDLHVNAPGLYLGPGYYPAYYEDDFYYGEECHWKKIKKVKWVNGHKVVKFKKKLICY
jgi:hypothetical protein